MLKEMKCTIVTADFFSSLCIFPLHILHRDSKSTLIKALIRSHGWKQTSSEINHNIPNFICNKKRIWKLNKQIKVQDFILNVVYESINYNPM